MKYTFLFIYFILFYLFIANTIAHTITHTITQSPSQTLHSTLFIANSPSYTLHHTLFIAHTLHHTHHQTLSTLLSPLTPSFLHSSFPTHSTPAPIGLLPILLAVKCACWGLGGLRVCGRGGVVWWRNV